MLNINVILVVRLNYMSTKKLNFFFIRLNIDIQKIQNVTIISNVSRLKKEGYIKKLIANLLILTVYLIIIDKYFNISIVGDTIFKYHKNWIYINL